MMVFTMPRLRNWKGERFTATKGAPGRQATCREASRKTHSPIGSMMPISSAIGMNSEGSTWPRCGRCQRISASKPSVSPLAKEMIG